MVNLCSIRDYDVVQHSDKCINLMIVRSMKNPIKDVIHFPALSPSKELFQYYFAARDEGFSWWQPYSEAFRAELQSNEKRKGLEVVSTLEDAGYTVNLFCYCRDVSMCHRGLLKDPLEKLGCEVKLL